MTGLAAWVQGPGGTIALVLLMLALVVLAELEGARRGRAQVRRQLAARQAERRAEAWLRQMRAAEAYAPGEHIMMAPRPRREGKRTSTAAFLDPPPIPMSIGAFIESVHEDPPRWSAPDVSDWTRHMAAELDAALDRLHEDTDQWLADHGIRDRT